MSVNEKMTAIADAIREKTGGTDALTLDGMAAAVPEVYTAGKQSEYDAFWDNYQDSGARTAYVMGFAGRGWRDEIFAPKYDIIGTSDAVFMFAYSNLQDLTGCLEKQNVILDLSQCSGFTNLCLSSRIKRFPKADLSNCGDNHYGIFSACYSLHTIDEFIPNSEKDFVNTFYLDSALVNLTIGGTIGGSGFDVHWSTKLTHESLMSIIEHLKDFTGTETTKTVTLGTENLAKLTDVEKAIATEKGWTLA